LLLWLLLFLLFGGVAVVVVVGGGGVVVACCCCRRCCCCRGVLLVPIALVCYVHPRVGNGGKFAECHVGLLVCAIVTLTCRLAIVVSSLMKS
jgi:hypothetical protein